jgi:YggT family protein
MMVAGYFLKAVSELLHAVLITFIYMMVARAIISWVNPDPNNAIVRFLHGATDPLIDRARRYIPPIGMFDMSVIAIILVLYFLDSFLVGVLGSYGRIMLEGATPILR